MMVHMHDAAAQRIGTTRSRSRYTSFAHATARLAAQRGLLKPLVWSLTAVTVEGVERLEGLRAPFVVVANHSSHLDAPLVLGALPSRLARYLAAGAAADYFFDVWWRKALTALFFNAFPVERNGVRHRSQMGTTLLSDGVPLLLFPEGTRSRTGEMASFKRGTAALCIATGAPCVPMALVGASTAMPRGTNWPVRGRPPVTVVFGAPMSALDGERSGEFTRRLEDRVRELHASVTSRTGSGTGAPGSRGRGDRHKDAHEQDERHELDEYPDAGGTT